MNWLKLFKKLQSQAIEVLKKNPSNTQYRSAEIAKERLKIIIAHQNDVTNHTFDPIFPKFQDELVQSIRDILKKHYANNAHASNQLSDANIHTQFQQDLNQSVLEINITVPELTG